VTNKIFLILAILVIAGAAVLLISFGSDPSKDVANTADTRPTITPSPEQTPIDPADVVQVDLTQEGTVLTVNGQTQRQTVTCTKYDRVYVNGSGSTATINGPCRQVMVNGDKNQITADAVTEFVFNGSGNQITYSRFVNGRTPSVVDNAGGNDVQKTQRTAAKDADKKKTK
jgi:hypothetical protein